jgi:hypothetical protein
VRRCYKAIVALAALAATALSAPSARAQVWDSGDTSGLGEQPRIWVFELRFGPYRPKIDDEFSGATPYKDTFGDDTRFLVGLEVDWMPLRIPDIAMVGPGAGIGYTGMSGRARLEDGSGELADQETSIKILPMYLAAVIRVDMLVRQTDVPLVPYAKAGLGYALWWTSDGDETSRAGGVVGRDASWGYQYALGLMLGLAFLDPDSKGSLDDSAGIGNAYLFGEWFNSSLDGFGGGNQMQVGTNTWMVGIAAEM